MTAQSTNRGDGIDSERFDRIRAGMSERTKGRKTMMGRRVREVGAACRRPRWAARALVVGLALATLAPVGPAAAARVAVHSAAGANPASIQAAVEACRADLGALNPNVAGSLGSGRREINWDGVPDAFAAPNPLPADFFNANSPRGAVFSTPGGGVQVSANAANPTGTPVEFGNLNPTYPDLFRTFSPQRLFTALGSNVLDVHFFVPGSSTPAVVGGFGAVFTDVDRAGSATLEFFDPRGKSLGIFRAPVGANGGLSFVCATGFPLKKHGQGGIARVRITSGTAALGPGVDETGNTDLVALDDFIYGEPQAFEPTGNQR